MTRRLAPHRTQRRIVLLVGAEVLFAMLTWLLAMVGLTSDHPTSPVTVVLIVLALVLASASLVAAFHLACRADPRLEGHREPWETSLREVILAAHDQSRAVRQDDLVDSDEQEDHDEDRLAAR